MMASFSTEAMATVWQGIEQFLLLEDTLAAALTCESLRGVIIDADTRKVRVSHFRTIRCLDRYARFLPWALNRIHFPSLRRVQYPPLSTRKPLLCEHGHRYVSRQCWEHDLVLSEKSIDVKDAIISCFPIFVANLSYARNLEHLHINSSAIMQAEFTGQSLKWIIDVFGRNLLNCLELKELVAINRGLVENEEGRLASYFSAGLMEALTPTILARNDGLESLSVEVRGSPANGGHESTNGHRIFTEFFAAISSATKLNSLEIVVAQSSIHVLSAFLKVASGEMHFGNANGLKHLQLHLDLGNETNQGEIDLSSLVRMIAHFSECDLLHDVILRIPRGFWRERGAWPAFKRLISDKPCLVCNFDNYEDGDGEMIDLIKEFGLNSHSTDGFFVQNLNGVSVADLRNLVELLKGADVKCSEERSRYSPVEIRECGATSVRVDSLYYGGSS